MNPTLDGIIRVDIKGFSFLSTTTKFPKKPPQGVVFAVDSKSKTRGLKKNKQKQTNFTKHFSF